MRYSIVTPSIARSTLMNLCRSLDAQSNQDFEHLIRVDIPPNELVHDQLYQLSHIRSPKRNVTFCGKRHMNCGNTCRHEIAKQAKGDYIFYIDDDDYFADAEVLSHLNSVTADWAIFPVEVCGRSFYNDPPGMCKTTTGGFLLRRGLIEWPDVPNYETDGMVVEELMRRGVPYQTVSGRCMTVHPAWNLGKML